MAKSKKLKEVTVGIGWLHAKLDNKEPPGIIYLTADRDGKKRIGYNFFAPLGKRVELVARIIED